MSGREVGNWLNGYMEYTSESESPDDYHIWTGLSAIASVTRRRTWLNQGIYLLFCNLYTALVGPPARTAKSTAIRMGRRLIQEVPGIVIGPDSCSREQLIRAMADSKIDNQCCMTIHSSEFSSILDVSGILMIQFLTDIYDCDYQNPKGWRYETKTSGKDNVINPYLNMLVGTTPSYIADSMPDNVIGHGFTSRTVFVYGDKERKINPEPAEPSRPLVEALVQDLHTIAHLGGPFEWDASGRETYRAFYHDLYRNPPADHRLEGYHWRKKIHVLKVAMLLSLAERNELVLDAMVIKAAVQILHNLELSMAKTFSAVGKYQHASDLERIGTQIIESGGLPISEVFRRNYFAGSEQDLRHILAALSSMGTIKLEIKEGKEWAKPLGTSLPWS